MNSRISVLVVLGVVVLIPVAHAFTAPATQQDNAQETSGCWEHLALTHPAADLGGDLAKQINRLGDEGWQLVCVSMINKEGTTVKTIYYFKRPK